MSPRVRRDLNRVWRASYDGIVKIAGWIAACVSVLSLVAAVLHIALPPNETPEEGPADPFLLLRRPVVGAIESIPFLRFRARAWLPSDSAVTTTAGRKETPVCRQEVRCEPVYRGLFWKAGRRIEYRLTYFREHDERWRVARLCFVIADRCIVAAENPTPDPLRLEVSGFVPEGARGYFVEYTDDKGATYWLNAWGQTEPFVGDSVSPWGPRERRTVARSR